MTRKTRIAGLAAFGLLIAGSAHALPEGWYTLGPGIPYKCHGNHMTDGGVTAISVDIFLGAADIRSCQALCDRRRDCVAFSFQRRVTESGTVTSACILLGRSDVRTVPISAPGRFDWGAVCYRTYPWQDDPSIYRRDRLGLEQDRLHPGYPGVRVPHGNK